ncbi:hypothetical protein Ancab_018760 [Ancistrocladus abbreviatus]
MGLAVLHQQTGLLPALTKDARRPASMNISCRMEVPRLLNLTIALTMRWMKLVSKMPMLETGVRGNGKDLKQSTPAKLEITSCEDRIAQRFQCFSCKFEYDEETYSAQLKRMTGSSEDTEEDHENGEDGWRYGDNNDDDGEETEYKN